MMTFSSIVIDVSKINADQMVGPTLGIQTVGVCVFQYNNERVKLYLWDMAGCEKNFDLTPPRYYH